MKRNDNCLYYIPPDWGLIAIFSLFSAYFSLHCIFNPKHSSYLTPFTGPAGVIFSIIAVVLATSTFSFYQDCIEVRILHYFTRRVFWENVTGAMYFQSITNAKKYAPHLLICISPCQPVASYTGTYNKFCLKYLRHIIDVPIHNRDTEVLAVMEQLGIKVEIQEKQ